jgi:hypothetical protein
VAGLLEAMEVEEAEDFGEKVPTLQVSECGV